jgi:hypothetical protein
MTLAASSRSNVRSQSLRASLITAEAGIDLKAPEICVRLLGFHVFFLATKELICKESFFAFKRPWLRFRLGLSLPCVGVESFNQRLLCLKPYALAAALAFT